MPEEVKPGIKKIRTADLKIGMYVHKVASSWLSTPFMLGSFEVSSQKDIQKLVDYEIENVYIDTTKGLDIGESKEPAPEPEEEDKLTFADTFDISLGEVQIGREIPVDLFRKGKDGELELILKRGLSYGEEVNELFRDAGITSVLVPLEQRKIYDIYKRTIEIEKENRKSQGFDENFMDPRKVEEHYNFMDHYQAISPYALIKGTELDFPVFERVGGAISELHKPGRVLSEDHIEEWVASKKNILIRRDDKDAYQAYMMKHTKNSKDVRARATFIRENSKIIIEGLAANPRSEQLMKQTKESVADLATTVIENPTTFYGLMKINNYDYYTFTHSVNVSTLSLALAMAAGITDKKDLADLGLGSILHDLGKSKVDNRLINKPGTLTDDEYKAVTNHVLLGYEMLRGNKSIPERALLPLLQHHEKLSGKGYPNKLPAEKIHTFGRISLIIDIYDALTTERAYKKAFRPFDALALIFKSEGDFDKQLLSLFIKLIHTQEI